MYLLAALLIPMRRDQDCLPRLIAVVSRGHQLLQLLGALLFLGRQLLVRIAHTFLLQDLWSHRRQLQLEQYLMMMILVTLSCRQALRTQVSLHRPSLQVALVLLGFLQIQRLHPFRTLTMVL
jgi:hypothetical protein